nr:endo-1,4-beta-xylanase [uncultured Flavobacterium sp.]
MNKLYKILLLSSVLMMAASCTNDNVLEYEYEKPQSTANQEVIDSYKDLKTYVDRGVNPMFKLGAGISLSDYTSKSLMYRLVNKNFDEITLGYEMKHGAIVKSDGKLDLDNVNKLLAAAKEANVSVFGHTLCWHANQNAVYLNSLIAPIKIPGGTTPILAGYALKMSNPSVVNVWEAQTIYDIAGTEVNTEYILTVVAKGSKAGNISADLQKTSDYSGNSFGTIALTTQYKEYTLKLTPTAVRNRFIINHGQYDGTVFIDNISLRKTGSTTDIISGGDFESGIAGWGGWGNSSTRVRSADGEGFGGFGGATIEKTAEEKKTLIGGALDKWISGMVKNCKTSVKAWDVVNEPMDDGKPYELKTGVGKLKMAADEFYWQDYMGKDYGVEAFRLARVNGNSTDILFINDYNLEYSLDKCKGLIQYVNYIETKGQKVDGIGTQMHIGINADKAKIETMFQLLAATGKLIKVSELDVAAGLKPTKLDLQLQSDMYKYVVDMYMKYIPANQRYGITVWGLTDSKADSSWLPGQNQGLWDLKFTRKTAYTGFANGLKGSK